MTIAERIRRYDDTFVTGIVGAFFVAAFVGKFWPDASRTVFGVLAIFWLIGGVGLAVREFRSRDAAVFADPAE